MTNPSPTRIPVWLVEDNSAYRRNAAAAVNQMPDIACTGAFGTCEEALAALKNGPAPQVVLMDIGLPGMNGIDGIRYFREAAPDVNMVVLTVFEDENKLFKAICAGASGYLLKSARIEEIGEAIRLASAGGSPMTPRIARRVLGFFQAQPAKQPDYGLTDREREILQALVEGLAKKQIADRLAVSFHTVDMHLRHIYLKLQVNTATGAVAKAVREKLV